MLSSKTRSGLSETVPSKTSSATPSDGKLGKVPAKSDSISSSSKKTSSATPSDGKLPKVPAKSDTISSSSKKTSSISSSPTEDNTKSLSERIKDVTEGLGVDYSFECTGVSHLLNQALESTKVGRGVTIAVGAINALSVPTNFMALIAGRTLRGSIFGGVRPRSDLPSILAKCMNKELQLDALVTHQVQLDDINHVFELQEQPDCLKIIIGFDDKKHL